MSYKYKLDCERFSIQEEEKILYDSIIKWLQRDSSDDIIDKFRYLFIKGNGCDDSQARAALEAIVNSRNAEREFNFIFSRCCQLIINEWQINPALKAKIPRLIDQISLALPGNSTKLRVTRKLRKLVVDFQESEQYLKLKRLSNLVNRDPQKNLRSRHLIVGESIHRYPYLHQQCLLGEDSSYEYKKTIINLQKGIQHRYELNLSRYITYRVRLVKIVRKYKAKKETKIPKKIIQPVKNPLLLSDRDLDRGLRQYLGIIENGCSYRDLASSFRDRFVFMSSHKELKCDLLRYLMAGLSCHYSQTVLQPKLSNYLDEILPDIHANKVDEFTLLRTSSLLLKFLIVDNLHNADRYFFVDMIANLGEIAVVSLILRIVLLCHKSKPYLEQRFAILFSYYENFDRDRVKWLINILENMQLALSVHFGQIDLSLVKII